MNFLGKDWNYCESVYWVFTQLCNDTCDHCYNLSGPKGVRITHEECMQIIDNLPDVLGRLILSGGEPLADRKLLYSILDRLSERYLAGNVQIMLQTNGDLLTGEILDTLIQKGVTRFDISSIDRYHKHAGERLMLLAELFESRGVNGDDREPLVEKENYLHQHPLSWGFWGATDDMWLGGNWARGRALEKNVWKRDADHNFCSILSGARNFLGGYDDIPQEISIQLWKINPCCPGTYYPMGDARKEKVADVLKKVANHPVFKSLNKGEPLEMGIEYGISREVADHRNQKLQNICLYCDNFFKNHLQSFKTDQFIPLPIVIS